MPHVRYVCMWVSFCDVPASLTFRWECLEKYLHTPHPVGLSGTVVLIRGAGKMVRNEGIALFGRF